MLPATNADSRFSDPISGPTVLNLSPLPQIQGCCKIKVNGLRKPSHLIDLGIGHPFKLSPGRHSHQAITVWSRGGCSLFMSLPPESPRLHVCSSGQLARAIPTQPPSRPYQQLLPCMPVLIAAELRGL